MITLKVHGLPAPQGSKRHVGNGRMVESSKAVGPWREAIRWHTQQALDTLPHNGAGAGYGAFVHEPMRVSVIFYMPRPKHHYGTGRNAGQVRDSAPTFPSGKPDIDKLLRAVLDGIVSGGVMADDSQVVTLTGQKYYADGVPAGAIIHITNMGEQ